MRIPDQTALANRRATPRPTYEHPQVVTRKTAAHHVWGDVEAGFVTDRVYVSTGQLHVLEYELPPGGEFRHSPLNQTVFAADVLYYVLDGDLVLADPSTGEVRTAAPGTGLHFRRGTWHNGFNPGSATVRVLELFSPPPARGTGSEFARRQPPLERETFHDQRWDGRWPEAREESLAEAKIVAVSDDNALWSFRNTRASHRRATLVDTEYLTVSHGLVMPGHAEEFAPIQDETVIYCTEGELWVDVLDQENAYGPTCLEPGEAIYLPIGCQERLLVRAADHARYLRSSGHVPDDWRA